MQELQKPRFFIIIMYMKNPEQFDFEDQNNQGGRINKKETEPSKEGLLEKFDALVVLGRIWRPSKDTAKERGIHVSLEGKMRTLAAGEMWRAGLTDKIIFSGGKTGGKEWPSEAESMAEYLKKKFPEIPEEAIIMEKESFDTPENAEKVKRILETYGINKIALETSGFHLKRSVKLFEDQGLNVTGFPAEELLEKRISGVRAQKASSANYEKFVKKFLGSKRQKWENIKEAILRNLLIIDAKGKIPRILTSQIRHKHDD